jgi:hypothetical protein
MTQQHDPNAPVWNPLHETWDPGPGVDPRTGYPYYAGGPGQYTYTAAHENTPQPKKPIYKRVWFWLLIMLAALITLVVVIAGATANSINNDLQKNVEVTAPAQPGENNAFSDVKLGKAHAGATTGWMEASVTITNHTDKAYSYVVTVVFIGADGEQIADGNATVQQLDPGRSATTVATSLTEAPTGKWTVKLASVTRL